MDPRIEHLKSTTFFGKRFTRRQIAQIQETVATFPALSRKELAQTLCEHLRWHTAAGENRVAACLGLLEVLEQAGIVTLPPKRAEKRHGTRKPLTRTARTDAQPPIQDRLGELAPLRLQLAEGPEQAGLFNEYVDHYHYLGYRQPLGPQLRYFLRDRHERPLGCLLFSQATRSLACPRQLGRLARGRLQAASGLGGESAPLLAVPWVRVDNLASHALSLAAKQLPQDWQRRYGSRPVLIETFVDPERFGGVCYRAANWLRLGQTRRRPDAGRTRKDVYVYPLAKHCREILLHGPPKPRPRPGRRARPHPWRWSPTRPSSACGRI